MKVERESEDSETRRNRENQQRAGGTSKECEESNSINRTTTGLVSVNLGIYVLHLINVISN